MVGFTLTAVFTGIICYLLGMGIGWFINRSQNASAVKEAYNRGEENAIRVHEAEKRELSEELLERLEQMKESLVSTYEAYEDAVQSVDERLSPGVKEKLTLSHNGSAALTGGQPTELLSSGTAQASKTDSRTEESHLEQEFSTTASPAPLDINTEDPGEVTSAETTNGYTNVGEEQKNSENNPVAMNG
ncbi:hypothetical protein MRY87_02655 [bacterium]|nr:hypothetical protein [bacterium]